MSCPHCGSGQVVMGLAMRPRRGQIISTILRMLKDAGPQGLTVEDLETLTHLPHQSVSARVHDLHRRGAIAPIGVRKNRSGRAASTWVAAPAQVSAAAAEAVAP